MTEMRKTYGRTPSGKLITEELIEKISREAEEGWDVEELLTWKEVDPASESAPGEGGQDSSSRRSRQRR
jgi:hypothetical protein